MAKLPQEILEEALSLPPADRAALADSLLESLDDDTQGESISSEEWTTLWTAEVQRRIEDLDAGKTKAVPWSEVRDELNRIAEE